MDPMNNTTEMLELLPYPAFTVADGKILLVNQAAAVRQIAPGTQIREMLLTGQQEYETLTDGCLYLTLEVCGSACGATVKQMDGYRLFMLDQEIREAALRAYALVGRELRKPLQELAASSGMDTPGTSRSLHQLLRLADNLSDAARYDSQALPQMVSMDLTALFAEIMEKAATMAAQAGYTLRYTGPAVSAVCPADQDRLERAVYNLLSNAFKFSPAGSTVACRLTLTGHLLCFTVEDQGQGIPSQRLGNVFSQFLRQPDLEDNRQGIGLGMLLIRSAAALHGGTVLLQQPSGGGSRITMTLSLQHTTPELVGSPHLTVDSGWDRALVELSEILPLSAYENL